MATNSCESDSNCVRLHDPSARHCPMGLGKSLNLPWMERMASDEGRLNDGTIYDNELQTEFARKHLIKVSITVWWPNNYKMFCVQLVVEVTGMDVVMSLWAPCTLNLYYKASQRTQDHFHPNTDQDPPPTRRRRVRERHNVRWAQYLGALCCAVGFLAIV